MNGIQKSPHVEGGICITNLRKRLISTCKANFAPDADIIDLYEKNVNFSRYL
jgi:hypothetical protein